ncbi:hypothetical protein B0T26DRAFT_331461 [Lasiosphaeria miniovina]|uniref:Ricin B lectin domain-containing protein n=1 Tax=Lasiosphaeria miniovina TaxID=1954250 RepID=A0AA40AMH0_9PEZI|nr:uncharacterized protein B0T26DRAFT_331461 [Lasiosphaeria miniovina]KAK0718437.1 hypothetical protein B0T26DRAFT_331461 [Lasiosphaeria miniovina]
MKGIANFLAVAMWAGACTNAAAVPALTSPNESSLELRGAAMTPSSPGSPVQGRSIGVYRPIKSAANTALCLEPVGGRLVLNPCANTANQFWGPFHNGGTIYRFQNRGNVDCMWVDDGTTTNSPVTTNECTLSDGTGNSVSNAEWDLGVNVPPSTFTTMRTHVGGHTNNLCITASGTSVFMRTCASTPGNDQRWAIGSD